MPRRARRPVVPFAALGLAALLSTAGCGGAGPVPPKPSGAAAATGSASAGAAPTVASATAPTASATAPTASTLTAAQLRASLPALPTGAKPWVASTGPTGSLTASQYADVEFGAGNAAKDLPVELQRGLMFAARMNWRQSNGDLVDVFLAQYTSRQGALGGFLGFKAAEQQNDAGATDFTLPDDADSFAVASPRLDGSGNALTDLQAVAGAVLIRVVVASPAAPDRTTTQAVAEQAHARLCTLVDCAAGAQS